MKDSCRKNNKFIVKIIIIMIYVVGIFKLGGLNVYALNLNDIPLYYGSLITNFNKLKGVTYKINNNRYKVEYLKGKLHKYENDMMYLMDFIYKLNIALGNIDLELQRLKSCTQTTGNETVEKKEIVTEKEKRIRELEDNIKYKKQEIQILTEKLHVLQDDYDIVKFVLSLKDFKYNDFKKRGYYYKDKIFNRIKKIFNIMLRYKSTIGLTEEITVNMKNILEKLSYSDAMTEDETWILLAEFWETNNSLNDYFLGNRLGLMKYRIFMSDLSKGISKEASNVCRQVCILLYNNLRGVPN